VEKVSRFEVRKEAKAWLKVMEGEGRREGVPIEARVGNLGANTLEGLWK